MKFGNSIVGLSLFFGVGFLFAGSEFSSPDFSETLHNGLAHASFNDQVGLAGFILGFIFLLIPPALWLFRVLRPSAKRFREIGSLFVGRDFFRLAYLDKSEESVLPFAQIQRLDGFLSRGVSPSLFSKKDAFETNLSIRLAILVKGEPTYQLHLKNSESVAEEEESNVGALYQEICEIKQNHAGMYQRIQFWHQF